MNGTSSPSSASSISYNANALLNRFDLTYSPTPEPQNRASPHWSARATEGGMSRREGVQRTDNTGPGRAIWDSLRRNNLSHHDSDGAGDATDESLDGDDLLSLHSFGSAVDYDWDAQGSDTTTNPHHVGNLLSRQGRQPPAPNSNTSAETIDLTGSLSPAPEAPRVAMARTRTSAQPSSASRKRTRSEANLPATDSEGARPGRSSKRQRRTATATNASNAPNTNNAIAANTTRPDPPRRRHQSTVSTNSSPPSLVDDHPTEPDRGPIIHSSHLRTRIRPSAASSSAQANTPPGPPRTIEQIDLCDDGAAENDRKLLERQRADQIASQSKTSTSTSTTTPSENHAQPTKLTSLTCTVCLDPPTDLTATACGHLFCRSCLLDWLVSAEREAGRRANCPACRKGLVWQGGGGGRKKSDVLGLKFLRGRREGRVGA